MKKVILIVVLIVVAGGAFYFTRQTPAKKVEGLKTEVVKHQEDSGYNECMRQVAASEAAVKKCVIDKLTAKGYTDGIDCIQDYTNPICKETARYNAEVYAGNDCNVVDTTKLPLTEFDCAKLLQK